MQLLFFINHALTELRNEVFVDAIYVGLFFFFMLCHAAGGPDSYILRNEFVCAHIIDQILIIVVELFSDIVEGVRIMDAKALILLLSIVVFLDDLVELLCHNIMNVFKLITESWFNVETRVRNDLSTHFASPVLHLINDHMCLFLLVLHQLDIPLEMGDLSLKLDDFFSIVLVCNLFTFVFLLFFVFIVDFESVEFSRSFVIMSFKLVASLFTFRNCSK